MGAVAPGPCLAAAPQEGGAMHSVANSVTVGSVGDLGRIARALQEAKINIDAIGGGEAVARGGEVGIISMLLTPDHDQQKILDALVGLDLGGGRVLEGVTMLPAFDLELADEPGRLADAAEVIGAERINIAGIISVDVHSGWSIVSLAFASVADRNGARQALRNAGFTVLGGHGGRGRRRKVDDALGGRVPFGDPVDDDGHDHVDD
jgi:hypothetical protein